MGWGKWRMKKFVARFIDQRLARPMSVLTSPLLIFCFSVALLGVCIPALAELGPQAMSSPPVPHVLGSETKSGFTGMDESVNEKMAKKAGIPVREPYINLESIGDVWNAVLLLGGGICGFIVGRWWHLLFSSKKQPKMSSTTNLRQPNG